MGLGLSTPAVIGAIAFVASALVDTLGVLKQTVPQIDHHETVLMKHHFLVTGRIELEYVSSNHRTLRHLSLLTRRAGQDVKGVSRYWPGEPGNRLVHLFMIYRRASLAMTDEPVGCDPIRTPKPLQMVRKSVERRTILRTL